MSTMSDMKGKEITEITLENDWEFRFEIESKNETVYLKVINYFIFSYYIDNMINWF